MAFVERANVVLEIADDDVQRYLDKGYSLTDGHGTIIKQAMPNDIRELQKLIVAQKAEIDSLKNQLAELEEEPIEEIKEEPIEKPKRGRRKKVEE